MTETFAPARLNFALPPAPTRVRTAWISDVHLGTRASGAARLLDFLRQYDFEMLYIVGDLIDIWQMRRNRYWPQQHNDVIQKILRKSRKGTRVIYIPGNHDEMISSFYGVLRRDHDPETCHSSHRRWPSNSRYPRTRARHCCAKREVARLSRRYGLPIPAFA